MKAIELLKRYGDGERNFRKLNLQGASFRGEDLSGADFSESCIQGADFAKACLRGTNFSNTQAGLQRHSVILLLIGCTSLLTLSSFPLAITGWWLTYFFLLETIKQFTIFPGLLILGVICIFLRFILTQGIEAALVSLAGVGTAIVAGTAFLAAIGAAKIAVAIAIAVAAAAIGTSAAALAGAAAVVGAKIIARIESAIGIVILSAIVTGIVSGLAAAAVAATRGAETAVAMENAGAGEIAVVMAGLGGVTSVLLSVRISWLALTESERHHRREKYNRVWTIANALASLQGTSFRKANLTDANFTEAKLKSIDLREAVLIRTRWKDAKMLGCARLGNSYLQNPKVRQLVENDGEGKDFDHLLNLQGINLKGAKLKNSNFTGSILNDATLENADLTKANLTGANLIATCLKNTDLYWAKLIRTQLDQADLAGACLTGACIEDWNITTQTGLDDIQCDYVFMSSSEENRRRQPNDENKNFEQGEFSEFIVPMVQTLNLYHNKSINPSALAIAYNELRINYPEAELDIASIEKRGKYRGKILLRVYTSEQANNSELHAAYFSTYDELRALPREVLYSRLKQGEKYYQDLAKMVERVASRPINYNFIEYVRFFLQGGNVSDNSINIEDNTGSIGNVATGGSVINLGTISGNVSTAINQLPSSSQSGEPNIKDLLFQLQVAIEEEMELGDEDKAMALEQVQALAEAGQDPKQGAMQKIAKAASTMLKGIIAGLPDTAKLVDACSKLFADNHILIRAVELLGDDINS